MRLFGSIAFTSTSSPTPYISQSQRTRLPASSLPLDLLNQNFVVTAGSMKALNTSPTGLRISISRLRRSAAWSLRRLHLDVERLACLEQALQR